MVPSTRDTLQYREREFDLIDLPLESYFESVGTRPPYAGRTTDQRRYVGRWLIDDGWLFLADLQANDPVGRPLSLVQAFPNVGERVFAAWFSGTIRGYRGDPSPLAPRGNVRAPDLVVNVHCGRILSASVVHHARAVQRPASLVPVLHAAEQTEPA